MLTFLLSENILYHFPSLFVHIDPHDHSDGDWEHPDRLWIEYTPNNPTSMGYYLDISLGDKDGLVWCASCSFAEVYGGHSETWSACGSFDTVFNEVMTFLESREYDHD